MCEFFTLTSRSCVFVPIAVWRGLCVCLQWWLFVCVRGSLWVSCHCHRSRTLVVSPGPCACQHAYCTACSVCECVGEGSWGGNLFNNGHRWRTLQACGVNACNNSERRREHMRSCIYVHAHACSMYLVCVCVACLGVNGLWDSIASQHWNV